MAFPRLSSIALMMSLASLPPLAAQQPDGASSPARLEVTPARRELAVGDSLQLSAQALDASGKPIPDATIFFKPQHRMFYNASRCGGVGEVRAKVMYAAVFHFGPRWQAGGRGPAAFAPAQRGPRVEENFEALKAYVETNNPSLEEIETVAP